jgi:transcriptional regulator with XRE-family HTH domain
MSEMFDEWFSRFLALGSGWIGRFESGETEPTLSMLLALAGELGTPIDSSLKGNPPVNAATIPRSLSAEADGSAIGVKFHYNKFDASYRLDSTELRQFKAVGPTMRDGLSLLMENNSETVKSDAVVACFLELVRQWPHANPSDIWRFIV